MKTCTTIKELRCYIAAWRQRGERIAFVPTMGNLHGGHLRLIEAARQHAKYVVVSIFVNPTQFGVGEDFASYPRTAAEDAEKLLSAGADLLFSPDVDEMYDSSPRTVVHVNGLSERYCGAFRPGHFVGVATVVSKLFNIVQPDVAIFGQKDLQQFVIIQTMVRDLNMPVELVAAETVREANGLAMSSRNGYLSSQEKKNSANLYRALCAAKAAIVSGDVAYAEIERNTTNFLQTEGFTVDYVAVCRLEDLSPATPSDERLVVLAAVRLGKTRLIDNIIFSK